MDTNKMREDFEAWFLREDNWYGNKDCLQRDGDEYEDGSVQLAWEGWQASRDAVVVALPADDPLGSGPGDCEGGLPSFDQHCAAECNSVLAECRAAIKAQGLKVGHG